mgnify:CR=1 FL=1
MNHACVTTLLCNGGLRTHAATCAQEPNSHRQPPPLHSHHEHRHAPSPLPRWAAGIKDMRSIFLRLEAEGYPRDAQVRVFLAVLPYQILSCPTRSYPDLYVACSHP